jgi:hypothetical protein
MCRLLTIVLLLMTALAGQVASAAVATSGLSARITVSLDPAQLPPMLTDAVTGDADGDGHLDRLTLTFSRAVDIVDGGGAGDGFSAITLGGGYLIAAGDYAATNVTTLVLRLVPLAAYDTGVVTSPTYHTGAGSTIASASDARQMGDGATIAGRDGAPPAFVALAPAAGATIGDASISYTLSEPLLSGSATWTRVGGTADPASPHVHPLAGAERAQGAHLGILLASSPQLVDGALYDFALAGVDAAGNSGSATSAGVIFDPGRRPRIVSEAPLWAVTGQPWTYQVVVDLRALRTSHAPNPVDSLSFALAGAPAGVVITKTGPATARVHWPAAAGTGSHHPVIITVTDAITGTSDRQEVMLYVVAVPSAGG